MRIFKSLLKILFVLVFICSIIFNILLAGSSYGSLIFKYDQAKFRSLNTFSLNELSYSSLLTSKNKGIQLKATSVAGCDKLIADYYFDENSNPSFVSTCKYTEGDEKLTLTYYYKDGILYVNNNGTKSQAETNFDTAIAANSLFVHSKTIALADSVITKNKVKATMNISFSPFYFLGVKYSYKDNGVSYKHEYDLNGYLRKTTVKTEENTSVFVLNYKNNKIDFPSDLENY